MDSFLFSMLLIFAIALGGRDQVLVARLSSTLERSTQLLVLGGLCALVSAGVMAFAGSTMADILPPRAANMLVAFALAIAAFELAWPVKMKAMDEPTRSYGAIGLVLLARQIGDAARFVIFALAAEATYPLVTIIGGTIGGFAALALGWSMGSDLETRIPLRPIRLTIALCLIVAALVIGLNARFTFL
ncbi:TMEM165/GDT1 family protein [uncultured Erythrobacter sp.]|uniref:TMEM165/GDT1 family protein n=1 Tax=uncultured Erythrobacter sp. TaxID=263913 RepID=UPI002626E752|nr:TMEM165/GDT1 family protein [uncultured Erythrobacter sp.]